MHLSLRVWGCWPTCMHNKKFAKALDNRRLPLRRPRHHPDQRWRRLRAVAMAQREATPRMQQQPTWSCTWQRLKQPPLYRWQEDGVVRPSQRPGDLYVLMLADRVAPGEIRSCQTRRNRGIGARALLEVCLPGLSPWFGTQHDFRRLMHLTEACMSTEVC